MKIKMSMLVLALISTSVYAGDALVCVSKPVQFDHKGNAANLSNKTVFICNDAVKGTIPELAAAGWKIVQIFQQEDTEHDQGIYQEMVIQKN